MTSPAYGTRKGLYRNGIRPDALVSLPRTVTAVDVPSSTFTLRGHGLSLGDLHTWEARGGALPAGLSSVLPYQAAPVAGSGDLFQVLPAAGGAAVTITDAGSGLISILLDLGATIDAALVGWSRHIDQHLPAHATPLEVPVPEHLELWLYWLVSFDLVVTKGLGNPAYKDSAAALGDRAKLAQAKLDVMAENVRAVRGAKDQTPTKAERAPKGASDGDRGWDRHGL
jgi:hypothetical protein